MRGGTNVRGGAEVRGGTKVLGGVEVQGGSNTLQNFQHCKKKVSEIASKLDILELK